MSHDASPELRKRLRRANGHLATIVTMVEQGRSAIEVAQQMQAVIKALESAKTTLITHHIEHHLELATGPLSTEAKTELSQLAQLARYL